MDSNRQPSPQIATTVALFAGVMMIALGLLQALEGIAAFINPGFYTEVEHYAYGLDVTAWGWIQLLGGASLLGIGIGVVKNSDLARILGVIVVLFTLLGNFAFLPYYPLWGITLIALDIVVLWALITAPHTES